MPSRCYAQLEKAMAPHCSTLAWKIPWTEGLVGRSPWGRWESDTTERLHFHFTMLYYSTDFFVYLPYLVMRDQRAETMSWSSLRLQWKYRKHSVDWVNEWEGCSGYESWIENYNSSGWWTSLKEGSIHNEEASRKQGFPVSNKLE